MILRIKCSRFPSSICGSQIYAPGTGQCFDGTTLCLYATNPTTGAKNIITYPCGTQCYDAGKYICRNGVLIDQTGVASIASLTSTTAQTQTQGATAAATTIQSSSLLAAQSQGASSAARASSGAASGASRAATSSATTSASSTAKASAGERLRAVDAQYFIGGAALLAAFAAGLVA